jgi:spore coat protein A, manganese oxidase
LLPVNLSKLKLTRRSFIAAGLIASAPPQKLLGAASLQPGKLAQFVDALPIPPVARKSGRYRLVMREFESKVHRDLPATRQWGYEGSSPGPTIETRGGEVVTVEWVNQLPTTHILPVDHNLMGCEEGSPEVRAIAHIHGAKCPPESDGYPENWYVPGKSMTVRYPNQQDAAMLWYHDHAMGITRLNTYAGLVGLFVVRDAFEDSLQLPKGKYEVPLVLCDRSFTTDGQFDYPTSPIPDAPWVDECAGDYTLVNGKVYPYFEVEPRKYRVRVLNASNSRFYRLSLANKQHMAQIGSDQGFLAAPVDLDALTLAPSERADVIVDFAAAAGQNLTLDNGYVSLMQFRVAAGKVADPSRVPTMLRSVPRTPESAAVRTRVLSLGEHHNHLGNATKMMLNGTPWHMPVTENPVLDSTEIWSLVNVTEDSHPIHLHLVRFQILDRRRFDVNLYETNRQIRYLSAAEPPEPNEAGWKDTVRAHSSMVTRIIIKFEGYAGRYVWHCHNLEHEDNEMMRPYDVLPAAPRNP